MSAYMFHNVKLHCAHKVHDFNNDQLRFALCNASNAPDLSTDVILVNLTTVSLANLAGTTAITKVSSALSGSAYVYTANNIVIGASGGDLPAWRYLVVYNDTPTTPLDPLICMYDRSSEITITDGQELELDLGDNSIGTGPLFVIN